MDTLDPTRLIVVTVFLAVLLIVWFYVQKHRGNLSSRMSANRRLLVKEALPLGHDSRLILIEADGKPFLLLDSKRSASTLTPLSADHDAGGAA